MLVFEHVFVFHQIIYQRYHCQHQRHPHYNRGQYGQCFDIGNHQTDHNHLERRFELARKDIRNILKKLEFCYQKAGLVKYDAYNQMGGNLSFCLCMLNERNSGFILNSVHSSDGCYTYTKEIKNGECEIALGEEERKALNMAIGF